MEDDFDCDADDLLDEVEGAPTVSVINSVEPVMTSQGASSPGAAVLVPPEGAVSCWGRLH